MHNTTTTLNTRTEVPPLKGLNIYLSDYPTQGLRPGLCRSIAPLGLITRPHQQTYQTIPQYHKQYNHNQTNTKTRTNAIIHLHTQTHLTNTTPQTPNTTMSPVRATLLHSPGWNEGKARYGTLGKHRQKQIELRRSGTYPHKQML